MKNKPCSKQLHQNHTRPGFKKPEGFHAKSRKVSEAEKIRRAAMRSCVSQMTDEDRKIHFKPAARRVAWRLARLTYIHLLEGNLPRLEELGEQMLKAYREKDIDNSEPHEIYITQLNQQNAERIGEALFNELLVETIWDLSQVRRSEVEKIVQIGPESLKWLDELLAKHLYKWLPELAAEPKDVEAGS